MANQSDLSLLIWGAVLLIVGAVLAAGVSDYVYDATNLRGSGNESITIASSTVTTAQDDVDTVSSFANASRDFQWLTSTIGFNITDAGVITVNGTISNGPYKTIYSYEGDAYVVDSQGRVLIRLITLFFVLGIFAVAILIARKGLQGMGVM